mgnify:CR=1 FL=1
MGDRATAAIAEMCGILRSSLPALSGRLRRRAVLSFGAGLDFMLCGEISYSFSDSGMP